MVYEKCNKSLQPVRFCAFRTSIQSYTAVYYFHQQLLLPLCCFVFYLLVTLRSLLHPLLFLDSLFLCYSHPLLFLRCSSWPICLRPPKKGPRKKETEKVKTSIVYWSSHRSMYNQPASIQLASTSSPQVDPIGRPISSNLSSVSP
jgi:hypothetical protein